MGWGRVFLKGPLIFFIYTLGLLLSRFSRISPAYSTPSWFLSQFQRNAVEIWVFSISLPISFVYSRFERALPFSSLQVYLRWSTYLSWYSYCWNSLGRWVASHRKRQYFQNRRLRTDLITYCIDQAFFFLRVRETLRLAFFISGQSLVLFDKSFKRPS